MDPYCGIGKIPKGKIRGTAEQCLTAKQVRHWGVDKIPEDLLASLTKTKEPDIIEAGLKLKKIEEKGVALINQVKKLKLSMELNKEEGKKESITDAKKMQQLLKTKERIVKQLRAQKDVMARYEKPDIPIIPKKIPAKDNKKITKAEVAQILTKITKGSKPKTIAKKKPIIPKPKTLDEVGKIVAMLNRKRPPVKKKVTKKKEIILTKDELRDIAAERVQDRKYTPKKISKKRKVIKRDPTLPKPKLDRRFLEIQKKLMEKPKTHADRVKEYLSNKYGNRKYTTTETVEAFENTKR